MNNRGFSLIELMIVVVIIGLIATIAIPNFMNVQSRAKEASTRSNTHTVQLAVENFAVLNEGRYPADVDNDAAPNGETIMDMMPGGLPLRNTFTNAATEPINAAAAANPGEIAYQAASQNGVIYGYLITAAGKGGDIIIRLEK